jgi:hypothetical protein
MPESNIRIKRLRERLREILTLTGRSVTSLHRISNVGHIFRTEGVTKEDRSKIKKGQILQIKI